MPSVGLSTSDGVGSRGGARDARGVPSHVLAAIEHNRRRLWAICYRMTGSRADADDLTQEAIARAIARADQALDDDSTGWLVRTTTRVCLDHLRQAKVRRRLTELVDPIDEPDWGIATQRSCPENALLLQEDLRFAIVVALQHLSAKQRAALVLRDVCGRSLQEIAEVIDSNDNAVKALLQRARVALARAGARDDVDRPADARVVERFAAALQSGSVERLTALLAEDVWGVVDGGGVVVTARKPTFGRRAVSRQWANAKAKLGLPVLARPRVLNGEPAIVVALASAPELVIAVVHIETRDDRVATLRVLRDPRRIVRLPSR